ncbi:MAG TPA: glycosyltransferase family 2 protein [Patescibacteria group bacterium]|nr:glycosyltransferase family 2 protein [Patescibacteria group bacterium]
MKQTLSVVLATYNEGKNLAACLDSVKGLADEIIIVDGTSSDNTVKIAKGYGAKVLVKDNPQMFHINKQKAIDMATGDWILQLDADERVSPKLTAEIKKFINMNDAEREEYQKNIPNRELFERHQKLIKERDGQVGKSSGPYVAFFMPRANYFLGRFLKSGGVYPDGVIRLFKKGKAYLPCKDVHEQLVVDGRVGWMQNDLLHYDSPTFKKYIARNRRYTAFIATQYKDQKLSKDPITFIKYVLILPIHWFLLTFFRHKGFKDSWQGFVFSLFSALRFPISYIIYLTL